MLPKINRLTKKTDFQKVFKNGRRVESSLLWLKFLKNRSGPTRAGFVVGTKISKKATERNKIKRQLRSGFRDFLKKSAGYDIIVGAKPGIAEKKFAGICRDLNGLLSQLK